MTSRRTELTLVGLLAVGIAVRLANAHQGLFIDEITTDWIVRGHSFGHVINIASTGHSGELTPPLFFILAWATSKIGGALIWLRLPSLIAGTLTIPLVYLLGRRVVSEKVGLLAAAFTALAPFTIYYSTEARAYAVMCLLVVGSTLALLTAIDTNQKRWWVLYAGCSVLALYTHYTCGFVLAAQTLWAFFAAPQDWRRLVVATAGIVVCFAPWLPQLVSSERASITQILTVVQPLNPPAIARALERWSAGWGLVDVGSVPGPVGIGLLTAALVLAVSAAAWLRLRLGARIGLLALLAVASLIGEVAYTLVTGTHVFSARDMFASWPALALAGSAIILAVPARVAISVAALALAGFAVGAVTTLRSSVQRPNWPGVAGYIEANARPGDVVLDAAAFTAVPLTPLDASLPAGRYSEFRLMLPHSVNENAATLSAATFDGVYPNDDTVPPPEGIVRQAFAASPGHRLLIVLEPFTSCPPPGIVVIAEVIERHLGAPFGPAWPKLPPVSPGGWCPRLGDRPDQSVRQVSLGYLGTYRLPAGDAVEQTRSFPG